MKLSINLKGVSIVPLLKKNISLLLLVFLVLVALLAGLIVFNEVRKVSQARTDNSAANIGRILRVNTGKHEELEKQLDENSRFIPQDVPNADAFGSPPVKTTTKP